MLNGFISNLPIMSAAPWEIFSPFLATTLGDLIVIFPPSICIWIPNAPSSLIAGPGTKSVGPAGISISSGAICPAFAFEGLFFLTKSIASSKESKSENNNAKSWVILSFTFFISSSFEESKAFIIKFFFGTLTIAFPLNFLTISWNCDPGIFFIETTNIVFFSWISLDNSETAFFFFWCFCFCSCFRFHFTLNKFYMV